MSLFSRIRTFAAVAALGLATVFAGGAEATIVRFQTTLGNIDIRLYHSATPLHTADLLNYINSNRYDGTFIHRSAKNGSGEDFVIQGGGYQILSSLFAPPLESGWQRIASFGNVTNEPGISNLRGTVALAKGSGESSGSSEWFINLNDDNVFLDQGPPVSNRFTVFGRVVGNGMAVADAIADLARVNASVGNPCVRNCAFREVPVLDLAKVQAQQDVRNDDVVRLIDATLLNLPAGDYDFNGVVNALDYAEWRRTFNSRTDAAADGNGNGIVDLADYAVWRNSMAGGAASGSALAPFAVPEPSAVLLMATAGLLVLGRRSRSRRR
jgi:peptidyl-prolyl cis-trans isomerase A (cyclophilin A)